MWLKGFRTLIMEHFSKKKTKTSTLDSEQKNPNVFNLKKTFI